MTGLGLTDAAQEARLLSRIIETISTGLDLDAIVQAVAALITETTATDVCFVHLLDDTGQRLHLCGATPPFDALAGHIELAVGEGVAGWVAAHGEPVVIVDNKLADHRYKYIPALRGEDFTSLVSVPVTTPTGHLVGVLNVHSRRRRDFTDVDVRLLGTVAGLMAGAIENARLHQRLAEREEALERFAERVVQSQEAERRRLAGDIHDGISQRIVSLSFHLSAAADALPYAPVYAAGQIARAQRLAEAALDETRFAIAGLRPPVLDDLGLTASLESLADSLPNVEVSVEVSPCRLPEHVETAVYRIAQEALQNVVKHAGARTATVRLEVEPGGLVLAVSDDGRGFDPVEVSERAAPTYGLAGMRERAELLGGALTLHSGPGAGTTLRLAVPLRLTVPPPAAGGG
jgi:signal transduction histidine kinase